MNLGVLFPHLMESVWFPFLLVGIFGFLTGLEIREYLNQRGRNLDDSPLVKIGTSRTYTFIALLGVILIELDASLYLYMVGMVSLIVLLGTYYSHKLQNGRSGLLQPLIALIVYTYGPGAIMMPPWFVVLQFVAVVFTLSARPFAHSIIEHINPGEILTLAKFLVLAGVILPLLPDEPISPHIPATPFKIWVAIVVISSISYLGYLLKSYIVTRSGYLLTGLIGGLYSSTATTVVLARRSSQLGQPDISLNAGIVSATGVMYLRLILLIAFLNHALLDIALWPLLAFGIGCIALAAIMALAGRRHTADDRSDDQAKTNPLELGIATLFALLFVAMLIVTQQVIQHFGNSGLEVLSFLVGFADIDPFVLSILNGKYADIADHQLVGAIIIAAGSNDLLKGIFAVALGRWRNVRSGALFLFVVSVMTIAVGLLISRQFVF